MEKISFRTATVGDWDFIEHLSVRVFSIFGDYGEILPQWLLQPGVIVLIGSRDERKMGFAMVRLGERKVEDAPAGELLAIAVMLQYGLGELHLHTARDNLSARCLFHRTGYRAARMKKSYYPKGQSAVMMVKKLRP
jgi:hypothetical protein